MCIAVYKPQGQKMPSKKIFSNCFGNNSHGAGFMFPFNGKVHYEKGFMTFHAFKKGLKNAIKKYGVSQLDTPMVFHFRITSQAGVKDFLTHPFPLTNNYDEMRKLKGDYDIACVHNGIIDYASTYSATDYSDTMEFIKELAYPMIRNKKNYYENKNLMSVLNYLLKGNRFAIMDGTGHVELIGSWEQKDGIFYSNSSYSHAPYKSVSIFKDYDGFKRYTPQVYNEPPLISKAQEKQLLDGGVMYCEECGDEMYFEMDEHYNVIARCFGCDKKYSLTMLAEEYVWNNDLVYVDRDDYDDYYYGRPYAYGGAK